jgi:glycosyltransferase involved in cell wall biosynthesis
MTLDLSIIVPAFNEAPRLADGFKRFDGAVSDGAIDLARTEVVFVDDGSTDQTAETARTLLTNLPHHRVISHPSNRGKGAAVRTGVTVARGACTAYMDADFAIDPRAVPRLLEGLRTNDVVIGSRALPDSMVETTYALRSVMGGLFNRLVTTGTGLGLHDTQCGFKAFRTPAARLLFQLVGIERFAFDVEILARARRLGLRIAEVPVQWKHVPGSTIHPLHDSLTMLSDVYRSRLGLVPTPPVPTITVLGSSDAAGTAELAERVGAVVADTLGGAPVPVVTGGRSVVVLLPLVGPADVDAVMTALRTEFTTDAVARRESALPDLIALGPFGGRLGA